MTFSALIGVHRVRIPRFLSRIFKFGYGLIGLVGFFPHFIPPVMRPFIGLVGLIGYGLLIASYILSLTKGTREGEVEVTETSLVLKVHRGAPRTIKRTDTVSALLVRRVVNGVWCPIVEVELRSGDRVNVQLADVDAGVALVRALGFGADGARLSINLAQPSRRLLHLAIAFAINMMSTFLTITLVLFGVYKIIDGTQVLMPWLQLALYALAVKLFAAPKVVVGRDGVLVRRGFSKKLYRPDDPLLVTALRGIGVDAARAGEVFAAAQERGKGAKPIANLFERGGLSLEQWRGRIASAIDGGYRTSGNIPDLAKSVLASADVTADERIGAALALRVAGDVETVRYAAEATADDRVRVVLDAVAAGADDSVVETRLRRLVAR